VIHREALISRAFPLLRARLCFPYSAQRPNDVISTLRRLTDEGAPVVWVGKLLLTGAHGNAMEGYWKFNLEFRS
jgi:hypothetical protein